MATKEYDAQVSSKKEFSKLALDGHNFPTWTMDLKVSRFMDCTGQLTLPNRERLHCLNIQVPYLVHNK